MLAAIAPERPPGRQTGENVVRTYVRRLAAALAVTGLLVIASAASANRLSLYTGDTFRIQWDTMSFITESRTTIRCKVTFSGEFVSRTIAKNAGTHIGNITSASFAECTSTMVFLEETLPWRIFYNSYDGTLPDIRSVTVDMSGISFRWGSISTCLYPVAEESPISFLLVRRLDTSQILLVTQDSIRRIPSISFLCGGDAIRLGGNPGAITLGSNFEAVYITLI